MIELKSYKSHLMRLFNPDQPHVHLIDLAVVELNDGLPMVTNKKHTQCHVHHFDIILRY